MKRKCKELKQISRGNLAGFYGTFILAMILVSMIPSFILMPFNSVFLKEVIAYVFKPGTIITYIIATLLVTLISSILNAGLFKLHLNRARKSPAQIGDLFSQFKKRPDRFIVSTLLIILISIVIFIPLIIVIFFVFTNFFISLSFKFSTLSLTPLILILCLYLVTIIFNIYIALRFSQYLIILTDHEEYSAIEGLKASWKLMSGNVGRLFYLHLSFIGIMILGLFSFGIAFLWIEPYRIQTMVQFYLDITGQIDQQLANERRIEEEMGPIMEY